VRPFKHVAFHSSGDCKGQVRSTGHEFSGTENLDEETDPLLGDIVLGKGVLLLSHAAYCAVQHG
jgi:hypothetical protein